MTPGRADTHVMMPPVSPVVAGGDSRRSRRPPGRLGGPCLRSWTAGHPVSVAGRELITPSNVWTVPWGRQGHLLGWKVDILPDKGTRNIMQGWTRDSLSTPWVQHSVEMHGGKKPHYLSVINAVEARPLYRVVREAVQIGQMPHGPSNINRCGEWGTPRIPVLAVTGGDNQQGSTGVTNPRPEWSRDTLNQIKLGQRKRIRY